MTLRRILRYSLYATGALAGLAFAALLAAYLYVAGSLPRVETLADYQPPTVTRVLSDEGDVIAEFYRERRILVPVERMPEQLIQAFLAAEDANFYEHEGIDLVSILRAALKNLRAGGIVQGGSTITQQVAKSLLLTPEKKFSRKFKEAILARRMEKQLSKKEILYLYLNQIYLGHGAYGVQAAAENYFDKDVEELSLAECAILAGLPRAPSRYSPYRHYDRAKERQHYVLERMVAEGFIPPGRAEKAQAEQLTILPRENAHIAEAAYFTEQVRRYLVETYGEETVYTGGLTVHTSMNLPMQQAARRAVRENLRAHDKRRGYRGPERVLAREDFETFLAEQATDLAGQAPEPGALLEAVLTDGDRKRLQVRFGSFSGEIQLAADHWAAPLQVVGADREPRGNIGKKGEEPQKAHLPVGSILQVRVKEERPDGTFGLALEQAPLAQGALVSLDPHTGRVKAMVGGYDFDSSQFNRVIQANRLPGSAIKPLIYAAALDKGYTPATIVLDTPVIYEETNAKGEEVTWKPRNYEKNWEGAVSFRQALAKSRNVITIKILEDIGVGYAARYVRKMGIEPPITRDLTLALGSTAVTPLELATAYSVFANGGVRLDPTYITKIVDRNGKVLESIDPADFPDGPRQNQRLIRQSPRRVISPETAYLVTNILESVVRHGTGWRAKALGRPTAGKTGTTNDLKDAWFAGYVPQLVAVSWVGYDQERPLGRHETGSRAAAPAWVGFMKAAVKDLKKKEFPVPDTIEFHPVDPNTGLLAPEDGGDVYIEAFAPGTAPTRYALDENQPKAQDFFKLDLEGR